VTVKAASITYPLFFLPVCTCVACFIIHVHSSKPSTAQ
jgi:hypothetical protein